MAIVPVVSFLVVTIIIKILGCPILWYGIHFFLIDVLHLDVLTLQYASPQFYWPKLYSNFPDYFNTPYRGHFDEMFLLRQRVYYEQLVYRDLNEMFSLRKQDFYVQFLIEEYLYEVLWYEQRFTYQTINYAEYGLVEYYRFPNPIRSTVLLGPPAYGELPLMRLYRGLFPNFLAGNLRGQWIYPWR